MKNGLLFDDLAKPDQVEPESRAVELPPDPVVAKAEMWAGLGVSDGEYECFRCSGSFFEIMQQKAGGWHLWCVYCGARQWEDAKERDTFVFDDGRYQGLTIEQVSCQDEGMDYLRFIAKKSRSKIVKEKVQKWLDAQSSHP